MLWKGSALFLSQTFENCDSVYLLINEIVENGSERNLEMDAEDVVELINSPDP